MLLREKNEWDSAKQRGNTRGMYLSFDLTEIHHKDPVGQPDNKKGARLGSSCWTLS
jgi:hypothetical protein